MLFEKPKPARLGHVMFTWILSLSTLELNPQLRFRLPLCVTWIECTFQGLIHRLTAWQVVFISDLKVDLSGVTQCVFLTYSEGQKLLLR
jgi:hypothetical protein